GLAVIGGDLDLVCPIDDVVVGHGVAVSRNEEARALSGDRTAATRSAAQAGRQAIRSAKPAEEGLHRGARLERGIILRFVLRSHLLVDLDAYRNYGRFHALDDIGEANRLRDLTDFIVDLRMRC